MRKHLRNRFVNEGMFLGNVPEIQKKNKRNKLKLD